VWREEIIQLCPASRREEYCGWSLYIFHNFINYVVDYVDVGGASCPGIGGLSIYIRFTLKYIDVEGASCPGIGGLNIYV
jgi:hypothetical protein